MRRNYLGIATLAVVFLCTGALADTVSYSGSIVFSSDLEPDKTVTLPSFDTSGGDILQSVLVEFFHSGSADLAADNDDEFQGGTANARIIRTFIAHNVPGWGFDVVGTNTEQSDPVSLTADDGDGDQFDPTAPDGHSFDTLNFTDLAAGAAFPTLSAYETSGTGTVVFPITPDVMVNDLQWVVNPDAWQLEVENPFFEVEVQVTYTYIPEPGMLSLMALGGLGLLRRRSR
ncbi:MAG: choice-of-anchor E domain-containing protein [Phycisphaerae bacterium]|nr:choice-of-anchor E domain-containing protein [Phycisphaerae bacterium]